MELTKLVTMTLENGNVRFIGYNGDDIVLMYDVKKEYVADCIKTFSKYESYRVEFQFSRDMHVKLFNEEDENAYPKEVPGSVLVLGVTSNYFADAFMYYICDTRRAIKVVS